MNQAEIEYHRRRRAFIIIPDVGIIIGENGSALSHRQILEGCGFSAEQTNLIMMNCPRGYFLAPKLVFYQGEGGDSWIVAPKNYGIIKKYYPDLQKLFELNAQTEIFFGVQRGEIGEVWAAVKPMSLSFFIE